VNNNTGVDNNLGNVLLQAQLLNNFNAARNGKGKKKDEDRLDMNRESKRPSYEQANQGYNWQPSFHQEPPIYTNHGHYHPFHQEPPAYINHGHHHRFHQESFHDNRDHRFHQQEPVYIDNRSYRQQPIMQPFHMDNRNQQPIYATGTMQATETEDAQGPQGNATGTSSHQ
jgi:hypothetical protein